ncbi:8244_t:CDS:1 [Funneliformis caledonium]|uniref:8244_t:CDS:1 n=1 Tax=Funneliformis caledonium TaxID=1117310 RepID=A0A9N9CE61_9GLOM|nr:8244_t:CDS:1 [Funneliformis caledonium]
MNSLELFFCRLYQYDKLIRENKKTGNTQEVEPPIFDMSFDFEDVPPATVNKRHDEKKDNENKREVKSRSSIRKTKPVKKIPTKVQVEPKSKGSKRIKNNLRIDMLGFDQKPIYSIRSNSIKRRKASE